MNLSSALRQGGIQQGFGKSVCETAKIDHQVESAPLVLAEPRTKWQFTKDILHVRNWKAAAAATTVYALAFMVWLYLAR